eukprot:TRINITY_DN43826_c0_g1_i1.p1 TRINITY_DN43826_c0_g1~~TRINITY_DN43826_c0_g1_i1.p1  ORF type:complete len:530 (-),score=57.45 TRINITY_DN43826_c0_g1_i1:155-1666(-)
MVPPRNGDSREILITADAGRSLPRLEIADESTAWTETEALRSLLSLLLPLAAGSMVNVTADRATLAFVGHWDFENRAHYDGAGLGKMYSNITGLSLGVSAAIGLATFCSQAHGEGKAEELNPIFLRRAALLLVVVFVFAVVAAYICEPVLTALKQPADVALCSARYAQVQLLGVPFYWAWNCLQTCLDSCKRPAAGFITSMISSGSQLLLCVLFTHPQAGFRMGYLGVALGRSLGGVISFVSIVIYVYFYRLQDIVWHRKQGTQAVLRPGAFGEYLQVSIPSALIVWSEWWAFEVLSIFVGLTSDAEVNLAAHSTLFNIIVIAYMTFTGTSNAVCTLVGNKLGAHCNHDIMPLLKAAGKFSICASVMTAMLYEAGKGFLAAAFTSDPRVAETMTSNSLGVVLSVPLYAQLMTFYGALRGANCQRPGILGTLVGYWFIGLPVGYLLGCRLKWPSPLSGIWLGNVTALAIAAAWVCVAVFVQIDWHSIKKVTYGPATTVPPQTEA